MRKQGITSAISLSVLLLSSSGASGAESPGKTARSVSGPNREAVGQPKASIAVEVKSAESKALAAKPESKSAVKAKTAKVALGDGFIAQNAVRVYLGRPMTISLHNARGQLLYHLESSRPMEALPLSGVNAGFLYLTLRAGSQELTKKLVYSGR